MGISVAELKEILKDFKDDDEVAACTCAEELLIRNKKGNTLLTIPLTSFAGKW